MKDKDIKCLAKVADDTFILGIRFSPDLLLFKRSQSNIMLPLFSINHQTSFSPKTPASYLSLLPLHLLEPSHEHLFSPSPRLGSTPQKATSPAQQHATLFLLKDDSALHLISLDMSLQTAIVQRLAEVPDKSIGNNTHGMIMERKVDEIVITTTSGKWESKNLVSKQVMQYRIRF